MTHCVVLTNTSDVYVDLYVNYMFCFKQSWYNCF